jgi:hypothetical protein
MMQNQTLIGEHSMKALLMSAGLALAVAAPAVAQDPVDNPLGNARVGDFATFKIVTAGDVPLPGKKKPPEWIIKLVVEARDDRSITINSSVTIDGRNARPDQRLTMDLTKPLDLDVLMGSPKRAKAKLAGEGKETIKIGDRAYDCRWKKRTFPIAGNPGKNWVETVWLSEAAPLSGLVKKSFTSSDGYFSTVHELVDSGNLATVKAAPVKNPFRNVKVGDFAVYKIPRNVRDAGSSNKFIKQVVAARDDRWVTIVVHITSWREKATEQFTIDLTRSFDPFDLNQLALFDRSQPKFTPDEDGSETITIGNKSYDCKWTAGRLVLKKGARRVQEKKVWFASTAPLSGLVKMQRKNPFEVLELVDSGSLAAEVVAREFPVKKIDPVQRINATIDPDVIAEYEKVGGVYGHWEQLFGASLNFTAGRKAGALHGFRFAELPKLKLPDVDALFGLSLAQAGDDDLKVIAHLKTMARLELGETAVSDRGLKHLAGLENLRALNLRQTSVTGDGLKELGSLKKLNTLWLNGSKLTDAGLKSLPAFPELATIYLSETGITDAGLRNLPALPKATTLFLGQTLITDAGLKELARLRSLKKIDVYKTGVTREGVAQLRRALLQCEIIGGP